MGNIKEFFKPTLAKIIIALVLVILFVPFINYDTGIRCITTPCDSDANGSILQYLINAPFDHIFNIHWLVLIGGLILSYLIACMIILGYKKSVKK